MSRELTPEESAKVAQLIADWPEYFNTKAPSYCASCPPAKRWPVQVNASGDSGCSINSVQAEYALAHLISRHVPRGRLGTSKEVGVAIYHVDSDGRILQKLYEKNAHHAQPVASVQKILTAYLAYKAGLSQDELAWTKADWRADSIPPRFIHGSYLPINRKVSMSTMIHTLLLDSANAAANAIARHYQEKTGNDFIQKMNEMAKNLIGEPPEEFKTLFTDASGLQADQYSTANNMARLLARIESDSNFMDFLKNMTETIQTPKSSVTYRSQLPWVWGGVDQFYKGGRLGAAGKTQIASVPVEACGANTRIVIATFGQNDQDQTRKFFSLNKSIRELFSR